MPSNQITNLATYKHHRNLNEAKECLKKLSELSITWCLRRQIVQFMQEHSLSAPDLLNILRTAHKIDFQSDASSLIVSGFDIDGTEFSLHVVIYPQALKIKLLKAWKGTQAIQQIA